MACADGATPSPPSPSGPLLLLVAVAVVVAVLALVFLLSITPSFLGKLKPVGGAGSEEQGGN